MPSGIGHRVEAGRAREIEAMRLELRTHLFETVVLDGRAKVIHPRGSGGVGAEGHVADAQPTVVAQRQLIS
jgi:hypothetical protein